MAPNAIVESMPYNVSTRALIRDAASNRAMIRYTRTRLSLDLCLSFALFCLFLSRQIGCQTTLAPDGWT